MGKTSAGILVYRADTVIEVLLVHPGGPYWANRTEGAWSIPKGEYDPESEDGLTAALREFAEELGSPAPAGDYVALGEVTQKAGKVVTAWAVEGDLDASSVVSNTLEIEWPPRSGRTAEFPEIDRAEWFDLDAGRTAINPAQAEFLDRLAHWHRSA